LAQKLMGAGLHLRSSLAAEAGRARACLDDWFLATVTTLPEQMRPDQESTSYWVTLAAYDIVTAGNTKWLKVATAARLKVVRDLIRASTENLGVDRSSGEGAGFVGVARNVAEAAATHWSAYYKGTKDAAYQVYEVARVDAKHLRKVAMLGSLMWELRSRVVATCYAFDATVGDLPQNSCKYSILGTDTMIGLGYKPDRAINAYNGSLMKSELFSHAERKRFMIPDWVDLTKLKKPPLGTSSLLTVRNYLMRNSRIARYVVDPNRMFEDLARFLDDVISDISLKIEATRITPYTPPQRQPQVTSSVASGSKAVTHAPLQTLPDTFTEPKPVIKTGYYWTGAMTSGGLELVEMLEEELDERVYLALMEEEFVSEAEFLERAEELLEDVEEEVIMSTNNVIR